MNRKSFSKLAKSKGPRLAGDRAGGIVGTVAGGNRPVGRGTNPRPGGAASTPLGSTRIGG